MCDQECRTEACVQDGGDCAGRCAPGCEKAWVGDGKCDAECNTPSCNFDGADCYDFDDEEPQPIAPRCAWGCPASWLGDGQCDAGCNVSACAMDGGDCNCAVGETRGCECTRGRAGVQHCMGGGYGPCRCSKLTSAKKILLTMALGLAVFSILTYLLWLVSN